MNPAAASDGASAVDAAEAVEAVVRDSYGRLIAYLASITRDIAESTIRKVFASFFEAEKKGWGQDEQKS